MWPHSELAEEVAVAETGEGDGKWSRHCHGGAENSRAQRTSEWTPTLDPGDVVILDFCQSRKSNKMAALSKERCAWLLLIRHL